MTEVMTRGEAMSMKLWDRETTLHARGFFKTKPTPDYCIVYEDDLDAPAKIVTPSGEWLAMAMHGNILPPVETYLRDAMVRDGEPKEHPYAEPIPAMSEEGAMEYLATWMIPQHVLNAPAGNRRRFVICRRDMVPPDRHFRNAFKLAA